MTVPAAIATIPDLLRWLQEFGRLAAEHQDELTALDSAIGDADHGLNMARGTAAIATAVGAAPPATIEALFKAAGMALISNVGGASGPLYGTFFLRMATSAGAVDGLDAVALGAALRAGLDGVVARGKAEPGDKTMVDALGPAVTAWEAAAATGASLSACAADAARAADGGRDATTPLVARKGRASYLGERSAGHTDPGSASSAMLLHALATALEDA